MTWGPAARLISGAGARTAAGPTSGGLGRYAPLRPSSSASFAGGRPRPGAGRGEGGGVGAWDGRPGCPRRPSTPGQPPSRPPSLGDPPGAPALTQAPDRAGASTPDPHALCRCASRTGRTPATCPGTTRPRCCLAESASCRRTWVWKTSDWTGQNFRGFCGGASAGAQRPG